MPKFQSPESFDFSKPATWPDWKTRFMRYFVLEKFKAETGDVQVSALVYTMGRQAEHIYKSFKFDPVPAATAAVPHPVDPKDDFKTVLQKFDDYFVPRKNTIHERTKFYHRTQQEGESVECFVRNLHELAEHCSFAEKEDEHIRDRLIAGMLDKVLSRDLQMEQETLTLQKAVDTARHKELVQSNDNTSVNAVNRRYQNKSSKPYQGQGQSSASKGANQSKQKCNMCGYVHRSPGPDACPARGKTCKICSKIGHFASVCHNKNVREVFQEDDSQPNDQFCGAVNFDHFIGAVNCDDNDSAWKVTLGLGKSSETFKIDTGADVSIMSYPSYLKVKPRPPLKDVKVNLSSPGGPLNCRGQFIASTVFKGQKYHFRVLVVDGNVESLLGRGVASRMNLIVRVHTVVEDIGCLKTDPVKIVLKENAQPSAVTVARRVSFPLVEKVRDEVKRLVHLGVIKKVTSPTPWCAPMVPVMKKTGKVRLCVDLKKLNVNIERERFVLPTLEDVTSRLQGATVFSCLDAASGFYQIPLEENSQDLTTFITPFGRYCFRRLPFGITSAPEIFMRKMLEVLEGLEGVFVYMDDILVFGKDTIEHDGRLSKVLETLDHAGLQLNQEKCLYRKSELKFLGHLFSKKGIRADPEKVKAIEELPPPDSVTKVRQFMGMVHYLGSYLPHLNSVTGPLNDLLKSDSEWTWDAAQEDAFRKTKELISSTPVLSYYDVTKPIIVSADSSSYGLGGVLLQEHDSVLKPIAFSSRTLTSSEKRYAQIEKECLASVWACEKFSRYICGHGDVTVLTDHKPLVPLINSKDLDEVPIRCQRLLMRLMRYNVTAKHVPGKDMHISDALSRSPLQSSESSTAEDVELHVQSVQANMPASDAKKTEIRNAVNSDSILQSAIVYTLTGWPRYEKDVPESMKSLYAHRASLSVTDGLLVFASRIVIPSSMRPEILDRIHDGHQGITKCLERARLGVWWPGITSDIKRIVTMCSHCAEKRPTQRREPLMTTPLPQGPWIRVGIDLFHYAGKDYLVMCDYYSRWVEVLALTSTTSTAVISRIKDVIARFGVPIEIMSDNGPQFTSAEFKEFSEKYIFNHITSSPYLPNSNGEAERAVYTAKQMLSQKDPWLALLVYRDTPIAATGASPSQLMMGRHLRTTLPVPSSTLEPIWPDRETILARDKRYKATTAENYDQRHGVRPLQPLQPGEPVLVKTDIQKGWKEKGIIRGEASTPRSYQVETQSGVHRRNRRHLKQMPPTAMQPTTTATVPPSGSTL